jgi:AcrR family transcriptional regulator
MSEQIPVPPWRKQRRSGTARKPLSQEAIVEVALRILDAEGLDAVSMRRVADELGTGAASLYAHVANKDELLDLVHDQVLGEIELPVPGAGHWSDQLRELARSAYRVLSSHNDIAKVSMANVPTGPNALRMGEAMLGILLSGGVPRQAAAWAVDRIALYINSDAYEGSLYLVRQRALGLNMQEYIEQYFGQIAGYYRSLPPALFPHLTANVDAMMSGDGEERFNFGLEMLIRSLDTYVGGQDVVAKNPVVTGPATPNGRGPAGERTPAGRQS